MPIHAKVKGATFGAAASIVVVWALGLAGVDVPLRVEEAFTVLLTFGAGWWAPDR